MLNSSAVKAVLKILEEHYGNTTTALKYETNFQLLVATIMSAQSTDVQVNKITETLFQKYPHARSIASLTLEELEEKIKQVGLYHGKAKNILAVSKIIAAKYQGEIPRTREELMKLPGVGRKTANVVISVAFNEPAIAVDTHVFRVSNRIGLAGAKNVIETEKHLMENIPRNKWTSVHHWLIWHGRRICKAPKPRCELCPLTAHCEYYPNIALANPPGKPTKRA